MNEDLKLVESGLRAVVQEKDGETEGRGAGERFGGPVAPDPARAIGRPGDHGRETLRARRGPTITRHLGWPIPAMSVASPEIANMAMGKKQHPELAVVDHSGQTGRQAPCQRPWPPEAVAEGVPDMGTGLEVKVLRGGVLVATASQRQLHAAMPSRDARPGAVRPCGEEARGEPWHRTKVNP